MRSSGPVTLARPRQRRVLAANVLLPLEANPPENIHLKISESGKFQAVEPLETPKKERMVHVPRHKHQYHIPGRFQKLSLVTRLSCESNI